MIVTKTQEMQLRRKQMSNRDLRTQSYGEDVALDCWVCRRGCGGGGGPHGAAGHGRQREARPGQMVMLTAAR